jgi:hypothetical protein
MTRRLIPKRGFYITQRALVPPGTSTARKLATTIADLLEGRAPAEIREVTLPPVGRCLVGRVPGTAIGLWYAEGEDYVTLYAVKRWGDW